MTPNIVQYTTARIKTIFFLSCFLYTTLLSAQEGLDSTLYTLEIVNQQFHCELSHIIVDDDENRFPFILAEFDSELNTSSGKKVCEVDFYIYPDSNYRLQSLQFNAGGNYDVSGNAIAASRVRLRVDNSPLTQSNQFTVYSIDDDVKKGQFELYVLTHIEPSDNQEPHRTDCGRPVLVEASLYAEFQIGPSSPSHIQIDEAFLNRSHLFFEKCDPPTPE